MRVIVVPGNGTVYVENVEMPVIGEYDCLVKIKSCLFCNNTDRHIVDNSFNFGIPYPAILGHESLGQVVSVGEKVKNFAAGDWVVRPYAIYPDEVCNGIGSGWGGFAEYGKIKDFKAIVTDGIVEEADVPGFFKYMQKLPPNLAPDKCMMISCLKEIYSSTKQISPIENNSFLIAGAGVAGCLFAQFLKMFGAGHVTVAARRREQLDFAAANTPADSFELFSDLSSYEHIFDAIIDTTGSVDTIENLLKGPVKKSGIVYSYAVYPEMGKANFFDDLKSRMNLKRIDPIEASVHDEVCQMLIEGKIDASNYITHIFGIDHAQEAWETVVEKKTLKTGIVFSD